METSNISAKQAGSILKLSRRRINQLVASGDLVGQLIGNSNVITRASVMKLKKREANGGKPAKKR